MAQFRWTKRLRALLGQTDPTPIIGIRSTHRMQEILDRERARASRGRTMFSLMAFTFGQKTSDVAEFATLAAWLQQRLRSIDDIGWLNDHAIGAVLPDTSALAASALMDEASAAVPDEIGQLECRIYTFPCDLLNDRDGSFEDDEDAHLDDSEFHSGDGDSGDGDSGDGDSGDGDSGDGDSGDGDSGDGDSPADWISTTEHTDEYALTADHVYSAATLFAKPLSLSKRSVDVCGALIGLVVLSPLLFVVASAIKLSSPGPIIFHQLRSGLGDKPFRLYKFRSMVVDAESLKDELQKQNEQDGPAFKIKDDPRMTRIGRVIRRTSIDELPQLWNVLKGDMSLVGPRPLPYTESEACEAWHRQRLDVTPGLTCVWQVRGRSRVSFAEWMRMDMRYIRERTLMGDLKLVAATVPAVISGRGAS